MHHSFSPIESIIELIKDVFFSFRYFFKESWQEKTNSNKIIRTDMIKNMIRRPGLSKGFERYISDSILKKAKINPENETTFKIMEKTCHLFLALLSNLSGNVFNMRARLINAWEAVNRKTRLNINDTS